MKSNAMGVLAGVIALLALAFGGLHGLLVVIALIVCWWLVRSICISAQAHHAKRAVEREAARQRRTAERRRAQRPLTPQQDRRRLIVGIVLLVVVVAAIIVGPSDGFSDLREWAIRHPGPLFQVLGSLLFVMLMILATLIVGWRLVRSIWISAQAHHKKRSAEREAARQRRTAEQRQARPVLTPHQKASRLGFIATMVLVFGVTASYVFDNAKAFGTSGGGATNAGLMLLGLVLFMLGLLFFAARATRGSISQARQRNDECQRQAEQQQAAERERHEAHQRAAEKKAEQERYAQERWRQAQQERAAEQERQRQREQAAKQSEESEWWTVLEIDPKAGADEIRRAYRNKIRQCHPDRVAGLAPEFIELAERRTRMLNAAYYEATRGRRGGSEARAS
jgi:DnaJ-domain-containing protein 1/uncharacterized membrane protein